jgi:hypothetical protein
LIGRIQKRTGETRAAEDAFEIQPLTPGGWRCF